MKLKCVKCSRVVVLGIFLVLVVYPTEDLYAQDASEILASIDKSLSQLEALTPTEDTIGTFTGQNFASLPWKNSVMFESDELKLIYNSLNSRTSTDRVVAGIPADTALQPDIPDTTTIQDPTVVTPAIAPAFYLNSVLFYSAGNWTIWVNHRRVRRNTSLNRLEIGKITKDYVEFIWRPLNLDIISPNWITKVSPISGFYSEDSVEVEEIQSDTDTEPKDIEQMAENIQNILSEIDMIDESEDQNENAEEALLDEDAQAQEDELDLPPIYVQEEFTINVGKLATLLEEEKIEITDRVKADEAIRLAREAERVQGEDKGYAEMAFDAYKEREIPFLWEYISEDGNILVDTINGVIKFRLGINQTFVSRTMEIVEGYKTSTILASAVQETRELKTQDLERAIFEYQGESQENNNP